MPTYVDPYIILCHIQIHTHIQPQCCKAATINSRKSPKECYAKVLKAKNALQRCELQCKRRWWMQYVASLSALAIYVRCGRMRMRIRIWTSADCSRTACNNSKCRLPLRIFRFQLYYAWRNSRHLCLCVCVYNFGKESQM